jgi:SAM-dependent methyltransferase
VTTSSEKWVVADRAAAELETINPRPPAFRLFDAGVGEGSVLARLMRAMHQRFPTTPFYVVGKELSPEDVRLSLEKLPDRFCEHPATVLVMTNMHYVEAPWLQPRSVTAATSMVWHELALTGTTGRDFERQISDLGPFLSSHWRVQANPRTGTPTYEKPVVLVIYRKDFRLLLDSVLPRRGAPKADFDFVLASQPYRLRARVEFKAERVIAPLARALGPGGRLLGIHSCGEGPGLEIIQRMWPDENPFETDRHILLRAVKAALGADARGLNFLAASDARALFRYDMHTLPHEISGHINTSTLLAAWNAATYVAQIEDERLSNVISHDAYLDVTREVLTKYGGLWFWDESYVISRREGLD